MESVTMTRPDRITPKKSEQVHIFMYFQFQFVVCESWLKSGSLIVAQCEQFPCCRNCTVALWPHELGKTLAIDGWARGTKCLYARKYV